MNFLKFNGLLLFATFPTIVLFSIGIMGCLVPSIVLSRLATPPKLAVFGALGLAAAFQLYFWGLWSATCVTLSIRFIDHPGVTYHWPYWLAAFGWATTPLAWFTSKEEQAKGSEWTPGNSAGAAVYSLVAVVAFLLFAFVHGAMIPPYGWALRLLGLFP